MNLLKCLVIFLTATFFASCFIKTEVAQEPAVIRIGTAVLTEKDIINALGHSATPEEILDYMRRWSDRELTYQAAVTAGLDKDETIANTIENMKKEFLSILYIQQEAAKVKSVSVSHDEIEKKYRENIQLYTRNEPVIKAVKMVFNNLGDAWKARDGLTLENFRSKAIMSIESVPQFEDVNFEYKNSFAPDVWNTIFNTRVGGITSPLPENGKFSIYLILEKENAGSILSLSEVSELIRREIFAHKNNKFTKDIYDSLRNRYDYSYDRDYIVKLENSAKKP